MTSDGPEARKAWMASLASRLAASPGMAAHGAWSEVRRTLSVHNRNTAELLDLLADAEHDLSLALELVQNVRDSAVRDEFYDALDQRLHNMLASAVSLVDHSRRLMSRYEGTDFKAEFERRNQAVASSVTTGFLRDLRNYLLHYGMPAFVHNVAFTGPAAPEPAAPVSEIWISRASLLRWDGWKAPARKFLEEAGEHVHLRAAATAYATATADLYQWTLGRFADLHGQDIDEANRLIEHWNRALTGHPPDGDEPSASR